MNSLMEQLPEVKVRVTNPLGLHTRPAVKLVQLAYKFDAKIELKSQESEWINARSLSEIMRLKATLGTELAIRTSGQQAADALRAVAIFKDFDEVASKDEPLVASWQEQVPAPTLSDTAITAFCVSEGVAIGRPFWLSEAGENILVETESAVEPRRLAEALTTVASQLEAIKAKSGDVGAGILDFQLTLLEDTAFIDPIRRDIEGGVSAEAAWSKVLGQEIDDYNKSRDSVFKARAADLTDLYKRVLSALSANETSDNKTDLKPTLVLTSELLPSQFLELDFSRVKGIISVQGGINSHVAVLARTYEIPFATQVDREVLNQLSRAELVRMECRGQRCQLTPLAHGEPLDNKLIDSGKREVQTGSAVTSAGNEVTLYINVDDPKQLEHISPQQCDGVGLVRTEFLLNDKNTLLSEEAQFRIYQNIVTWAAGKPVTIRTLDAGGDKPVRDLSIPEQNPLLGLRGLRLSLARQDVFVHQVRALLRVAATNPLKVMFPVVSLVDELEEARHFFSDELMSLKAQGVKAAMPALGIMVETPAAALRANDFNAAFFSIGTNDLVQYTFAADRSRPEITYLQQSTHPAILDLIEHVVLAGQAKQVEVSICGEVASQLDGLSTLLKAGVSVLSIPINALSSVKRRIAHL